MSNTLNILNTLVINNNLYNNQFQALILNLQTELKKIVNQAQLELINNISKDYNISSKELIRKYITNKKQPNNIIDSPTFDMISKLCNPKLDEIKISNKSNGSNISDDQESNSSTFFSSDGVIINIDENIKTKTTTRGRPGKKKSNVAKKDSSNDEEIEDIDHENTTLFKPINIKGKNYLLNIKTNEIYDENNICIGIKKENKYLIKKT